MTPPTLRSTPTDDPAPGLEATAWDAAPSHPLLVPGPDDAPADPREPGGFRLLHSPAGLHLRADLIDGDAFTHATGDRQHLWDLGDAIEWFIGPPPREGAGADAGLLFPTPYIELHAAPNGLRTLYRVRRVRLPERPEDVSFTSEVALTPGGWSAVFHLRWDDLCRLCLGETRSDAASLPWTVLVGRYNRGDNLPYRGDGSAGAELSGWPRMPRADFHLRALHAPVVLTGSATTDA